ncbi:MAG: pyridoxal phosphate-dependent aminotransferase [Candidatus Eisenbacteria bacterium]|nr:pyridoxal phosphate-dependent aminotransferase [Candidatus Eisenbacteria bacterium]
MRFFSGRTRWDLGMNDLARRHRELLASGERILDLTESNPTRCGISYPVAEILDAISDPAVARYDPQPLGSPCARRAVRSYCEERGVSAAEGDIVLCSSTSEAYAWLFKLLCDAGDEVLIPAPSYPLFDFIAQIEDVKLLRYPIRYEDGWRIDLDRLDELATGAARAIVLVHPNNPTGSYISATEIERIRRIAEARGLAIISDEVFADFPFEEPPPGLPTLASPCGPLAFSLGGLSKLAGLPQLKLSWILASGSPSARLEALGRLEVIGDTFLSVGIPVMAGCARLLEIGAGIRERIRSRIRANREILLGARKACSSWECLRADGGWFSVLRVPRIMADEDLALRLLEDERILVHPGHLFDFDREGFLVVSLLPPSGEFEEAAERLARALEKIAG